MQLDSSSVPPFLGAQDLMKLASVYDAFTLLKLLFNDYGYVYLEGTTISDNGAYLIHPANWPKSDIESAKKCWPAMERAGLQFIGLPEPIQITKGQTVSYYDGLLNGKKCDLKFLESKSSNPYESISAKMKKASKQGAEIVVIVIDISFTNNELKSLRGRLKGKMDTLKYSNLKEVILIK